MDNNRQGAKASYVALVFFIGLWMLVPSAVRRFNREAFAEFQAPALHLVGKGRDLARYWELKSRSPEELTAASRDLARINAALELKIHTLDDARKENVRLRELLRYPSSTEFVTLVARVSVRETSSWWQRIIIRKGRSDGVVPGCPVVFGDRVIGRVSIVHLTTSEVDLVTSPSFRCTAFLEGDDQNNVVHVSGGAGLSLKAPRALVSIIPVEYNPPAGQIAKVMTTGLGGVFPAHLTLGTLESGVHSTAEKHLQEGVLTPAKELNFIQEVSVLIPKYPTAGEILLTPADNSKPEEFR
jgi:rod shape-determining protein MreC